MSESELETLLLADVSPFGAHATYRMMHQHLTPWPTQLNTRLMELRPDHAHSLAIQACDSSTPDAIQPSDDAKRLSHPDASLLQRLRGNHVLGVSYVGFLGGDDRCVRADEPFPFFTPDRDMCVAFTSLVVEEVPTGHGSAVEQHATNLMAVDPTSEHAEAAAAAVSPNARPLSPAKRGLSPTSQMTGGFQMAGGDTDDTARVTSGGGSSSTSSVKRHRVTADLSSASSTSEQHMSAPVVSISTDVAELKSEPFVTSALYATSHDSVSGNQTASSMDYVASTGNALASAESAQDNGAQSTTMIMPISEAVMHDAIRPVTRYRMRCRLSMVAYFEITIGHTAVPIPPSARGRALSADSEESCISIGVATQQFPRVGRQPGWDRRSFGYHGDDGDKYHGNGVGASYGPPFGAGDTVGCGIDYRSQSVFFTKNGNFLGVAFPLGAQVGWFYPVVGIDSRLPIYFNFGLQPFVFNVVQFEDQACRLVPPLRRWLLGRGDYGRGPTIRTIEHPTHVLARDQNMGMADLGDASESSDSSDTSASSDDVNHSHLRRWLRSLGNAGVGIVAGEDGVALGDAGAQQEWRHRLRLRPRRMSADDGAGGANVRPDRSQLEWEFYSDREGSASGGSSDSDDYYFVGDDGPDDADDGVARTVSYHELDAAAALVAGDHVAAQRSDHVSVEAPASGGVADMNVDGMVNRRGAPQQDMHMGGDDDADILDTSGSDSDF